MSEGVARVRISKVRFRDGRELTILPPNDLDGDTTFIYTLVRLLELARQGHVRSYCGAVILDEQGDDDHIRYLEFGDAADEYDRLHLIALIEMAKGRLMEKIREAATNVL
jgi:hypothetical protein